MNRNRNNDNYHLMLFDNKTICEFRIERALLICAKCGFVSFPRKRDRLTNNIVLAEKAESIVLRNIRVLCQMIR